MFNVLKPIIVLSVFFTFNTLAVNIGDHIAKVIQISKSQKTIILNRGIRSGFRENDYAYILGSSSVDKKQVYYPVAKLRIVKKSQSTSIWLVVNSFKNKIIKDEKYLFFTLSDFLKGRSPIKISKKTIASSKQNRKINIQDSMSTNDYKLSKKKSNYRTAPIDSVVTVDTDYDIKLIDIDGYDHSLNIKKRKPIYMGPKIEDYRIVKDLNTFDKMIYALLKNSNSTKDKMIDQDQMYLSFSQRKRNDQLREDENLEKISKLYLENGESWSDELSDEELSRVLYRVGELKENSRRKSITAQQFNGQAFLNVGTNLSSELNSNAKSAANTNIFLGFSAELFVLKKFKDLSSLTLDLEGVYSKQALGLKQYNSTASQFAVAGYINWYPFDKPNLIDSNLWFVSLGSKVGFYSLYVQEIEQTARYQSFTFPSFRIGSKYNFSPDFGIRLFYQAEAVTLNYVSGYNQFESEKTYSDSRLVISMSKFY
jgi:hypothetical protein